MSLEPKKPIEEVLEASARARRAAFGSDPTMPNPMRARLHEEISRPASTGEAGAQSSLWTRWWPQITLAAAAALFMIAIPALWQRGPGRETAAVAYNESAPRAGVSLRSDQPKEFLPAAPPPIAPLLGAATAKDSGSSEARAKMAVASPGLGLPPASEAFADANLKTESAIPSAPAAAGRAPAEAPGDVTDSGLGAIAARSRPSVGTVLTGPVSKGAELAGKDPLQLETDAAASESLARREGNADAAVASAITEDAETEDTRLPASSAMGAPVMKGKIAAKESMAAAGAKTDAAKSSPTSVEEKMEVAPYSEPETAAAAPAQRRAAANFRQNLAQNAAQQTFRSRQNQAINVLNNFQVVQEGPQIRITDEDGSTYTGKLRPVARFQLPFASPASAKRASEPPRPTDNESRFRATGYNKTLGKKIVLEGTVTMTAAPAQNRGAKEAEQTPARIVGTAKIPGELPLQLDATAVR